LHCPNCGAAVDPDARRCPYCQARLAAVACPACFALLFEGAAFCSTCGAARARGEQEPTEARCPGCRNELQALHLGGTPLLECAACDGVWVTATAFERLCADKEVQAAVLHRWTKEARPLERAVRYRPCVQCGKMMNRVNFAQVSGTVIDVCRGHGTYLDAGELHHIAAFIHGGGLERARARQLEDLREKERELKDVETRAERAYRSPELGADAGATAGGWSAGALLDLISVVLDR
jgi:Zn-finger nucleic acid-binding protein